jgi:hypothetical protein
VRAAVEAKADGTLDAGPSEAELRRASAKSRRMSVKFSSQKSSSGAEDGAEGTTTPIPSAKSQLTSPSASASASRDYDDLYPLDDDEEEDEDGPATSSRKGGAKAGSDGWAVAQEALTPRGAARAIARRGGVSAAGAAAAVGSVAQQWGGGGGGGGGGGQEMYEEAVAHRRLTQKERNDLRGLVSSLTRVDDQLAAMRRVQGQDLAQGQGQGQEGVGRALAGAPRYDSGSPSRLGLGAADDPSVQLQYAEFRSQGIDYSSTFSASGFTLPGGQSLAAAGQGQGQGQGQSMLSVLRQVARGRKQETPSPRARGAWAWA